VVDPRQLVGERLHIARRRAGMTQGEVGDKLGVTGVAVGQWENGRREPNFRTLRELAAIYGVSVQFFFEGMEEIEPSLNHFLPASARLLALAA
jgi:transcriptional regulator with XRE-family HTH domain